ncbi:prothoracicostatic peptide-like protein [Dinothrombium tinctorium]|uniref:Prothoracicostatic peptide-like protein n=1 Tax=Dinothrombium tinctorium TaxID=1965070 RepID=A0A3S4QA98_9ACAR|nr:prothoracicostatic peptide-like protein [Dinothrombium tinctorium]
MQCNALLLVCFEITALIVFTSSSPESVTNLNELSKDAGNIGKHISNLYASQANLDAIDDDENEFYDNADEKRAQWNKLHGGWGKRADNWNKLSGVWGKRADKWNNLNGLWGKRAAKWNELNGMWGKRGWNDLSGGWGKRTATHWNNLRGMWGKRSVNNADVSVDSPNLN